MPERPAGQGMHIVLYRRTLSLTSGGGQLIRMQAEGLRRAGRRVSIACQRGALRFFLRSGMRAKVSTVERLQGLAASPAHLLVDHGMELPRADLVFVHNLMTEAVRHFHRADWIARARQEKAFFEALGRNVMVLANSRLVRDALLEHFALNPARVRVQYPGFDSTRFHQGIARSIPPDSSFRRCDSRLRRQARAALGIGDGTPLIGFVTSGEFGKRGLDIFLETAERILTVHPEARFLVVGAKRLPTEAARHSLSQDGRLLYRSKSLRPERWFAALDIFLYPALFEEYGMVISEAQAIGLPVLTSRRVGAAECLPENYGPWLIDVPESRAFAAKAVALLENEDIREELSTAGIASVKAYNRERYLQATVQTIKRCANAKVRSGDSGTH